jgi:hypothetical protein
MRILLLTTLFLASCSTLGSRSQTITGEAARSQFARLSALEGKWYATDGSQDGPVLIYETVAAGHAVIETDFPGTPHQMVTMYYLEGETLKLVHYCAVGNRPRMVARPKDGVDLYFELEGDGGLASPNEMHMHSAAFHFEGPNNMSQSWALFEGGVQTEAHAPSLERRPAVD